MLSRKKALYYGPPRARFSGQPVEAASVLGGPRAGGPDGERTAGTSQQTLLRAGGCAARNVLAAARAANAAAQKYPAGPVRFSGARQS